MTAKDTVLFGKYQLIRILGQGRNGDVFLARHLELDAYRAIKRVLKSSARCEQFRREALLLKRLKHPCIPIVYDLEEDSQFSYLVEEFLEGDSLYDLVQSRGPLNQDAVIRYGIQICGLVQYLHSAETIPILYLDLQPRNLLVCHGQVKLLDFDRSDTLMEANEVEERYGTEGFVAPEQRNGGYLDVRTDVYQIGAILAYMSVGAPQAEGSGMTLPGELGSIIRRCRQADPDRRYASADEVAEALGGLRYGANGQRLIQIPSLTIALASARAGAGTTHIAIGLACWLNRQGYPALYEEKNRSGDVRAMGERLGISADSYGIYTIRKLPMMPRYGDAVQLAAHAYPTVVSDYGTEITEAAGAVSAAREAGGKAVLLIVCGGKWWDGSSIETLSALLSDAGIGAEEGGRGGLILLYNRVAAGALSPPASLRRCRSFKVPYFADPFRPEGEAGSFCGAVLAGHMRDGEEVKGQWHAFIRKITSWGSRGSSA